MTTIDLCEWALHVAEHGWPVFPLRPGEKTPALHGHTRCPRTGACVSGHQGWEQRATTDPDVIRRCWSHDAYNIGLATGRAGLVVVDLDVPKHDQRALPEGWNMLGITRGLEVLAHLATRAGHAIPATYAVRTGSGGRHLYFRAPRGIPLRNTAGVLGPMVDTRAAGGYVVAPGSITPTGTYQVLDDREPVDLPGWLVQALAPKPSQPISAPREIASANRSRYLQAALDRESKRVAGALPGGRNKALFIAACALGQLVAGGVLAEADARAVLEHAAEAHVAAGAYSTWQRDKTITSGLRAGASRPRTLDVDGRQTA